MHCILHSSRNGCQDSTSATTMAIRMKLNYHLVYYLLIKEKVLNTITFKIFNNGCPTCAGSRLYDNEVIPYANTRPDQKHLINSAHTWFCKHKFGKWVNNMRRCAYKIGKDAFIAAFGTEAWNSLLVITSNYGNECHLVKHFSN